MFKNEKDISCASDWHTVSDADGSETTSVLSDHERGNLAVLYDGTLLWIEEVEVEVEHVFTRK